MKIKHGHAPKHRSRHPEYNLFVMMRCRCRNPKGRDYHLYGGRGIRVCERWLNGDGLKSAFECFIADMGPRPLGMSIDRINANGNYEPDNCRWATAKQQGRNTRWCKLNEAKVADIKAALLNGEHPKELAKRHGVVPTAIYNIKSGLTWAGVEPSSSTLTGGKP
jgi:hypothetical protein